MVSNAPFYSGKNFALGRSVPFWMMLLFVLVFVFVSSDPPIVLFGLFVVYGLSGWALMLWRWQRARTLRQRRSERRQTLKRDEDQDRKSTRLNSSHVAISYAVFCLKKKR